MKFLPVLAVALSAALPTFSQAAAITASYAHGTGSTWTADFTVTNDGTPATVGGFTVYFAENLFSGLSVVSSPSDWDSIVLEPDTLFHFDGYFDSQVFDWSQPLLAGASASGFSVQFTYLGTGAPGSMLFDIYDQSYDVTFQGETTAPVVAEIPEPNAALLALLGLGALGATRAKRRQSKELVA